MDADDHRLGLVERAFSTAAFGRSRHRKLANLHATSDFAQVIERSIFVVAQFQLSPTTCRGAGNRADEQGPFLVLNVLDVPRSIANVRIFGVKADIANWAMTLDELAGGRFFKICDYSDPALLTLSAGDGIMEQWGRIQ